MNFFFSSEYMNGVATLLVEFSAKGCIFLPFGKLFLVIFPANATLFCLKIIKSCIDFAKICCACNSLELLDEIALHRENKMWISQAGWGASSNRYWSFGIPINQQKNFGTRGF